ncbi:MAG: ABC transporter permease, partial [Parvularculaceae bacterium]
VFVNMEVMDQPSTPEVATTYSAHANSGPLAMLRDLRDGFAMGPVWRAFAWDEIQQRYRRSVLGVAWIGISYLIFVAAISLFFSGFATLSARHFIFYVALGFAGFTFLIGNVTDGCQVFRAAGTWIKSTPLPYSVYVYKSIARSVFPFLIQLAVGFSVMAVLGWRPTWGALYALPALAVYLVNAVWVQFFFGLFATRWRDFSHLVAAITRVLFFATPILWVYAEQTGLRKTVAGFNPLTHFLEIFRAPLLGDPMLPQSWPAVLGVTMAGWTATILVASVMRRRLPFWV